MMDRGDSPIFPPNPAPYITDWLFDIGPTIPTSMGETVLGYVDLVAWQEISGVELMPWEANLIKRLSRTYLAMSQKANDLSCPMPYSGTIDDVIANRDVIDGQIMAAFGNLKKVDG